MQEMIDLLQEVIRHERTHFNFYLQAAMCVSGIDRVYLKPIFEKEMNSELGHIQEFGNKIVALGACPVIEMHDFIINKDGKSLLKEAIRLERKVLKLYHEIYPKAEAWAVEKGDKSIVLLLEDNIEHTTEDVEEFEKLFAI